MAGNLFGPENEHPAVDSENSVRRVSCPKKILLAFGSLLVLAALFVPYRVRKVSYETDPQTRLIMRRVFYDRGFMFLPGYLAAKGREPAKKDAAGKYYSLDRKVLAAEFSLIVFLGVLDYLLFCLFLKKKAPARRETW
jgi:hypothetical protein